jgi:hypothetical protein
MRAFNIILALVIISAAAGGAEWEVETLDRFDDRDGSCCDIALDKQGRPHIAYFGGENHSLKYAFWNGEEWVIAYVEADVDMVGKLALALDSEDHAHIAYHYYTYRHGEDAVYEFKYARWNGEDWIIRDVDPKVGYNGEVAIAVDRNDRPHIVYSHVINEPGTYYEVLRYAYWEGDRWKLTDLASQRFLCGPILIGLDANDNPYLVMCDRINIWTGTGWEVHDLPGTGSFAFGPQGKPHVAYSHYEHYGYADPEDGELWYACRVGEDWRIETVDDRRAAGPGCSLAVDGQGLPYISYYDMYDFKVAHYTGHEWVLQTVDGSEQAALYHFNTSIALDQRSYPHVAYFDRVSGGLKYAVWTGGEWRNPPAEVLNRPKDISASGNIERWLPGVLYWLPQEPWDTVVTDNYVSILEHPVADAEELYFSRDDVSYEVIDGRSVRVSHYDMAGEEWITYDAWLKIRTGDVEGWFTTDYSSESTRGYVRFNEAYSPLREGPSYEAPPITPDVKPGPRLGVKPEAAAGQYYKLITRCGDWYCIDRGFSRVWVPADATGLEIYYLVYLWFPNEVTSFSFYFPVGANVDQVLYKVSTYMGSGGLPRKTPVFSLTTKDGTSEFTPEEIGYSGGYESGTLYYAVTLPVSLKREDITSFSFTIGDDGERIKFTLDPREAWAEYDAGR